MIKSILKLAALLIIGILIYNYFLGSPSEKDNAQKIFGEMKDVGLAVTDLLKSEKQKFDSGKYDKAIDKIGGVIDKLKSNAKSFDEKYLDRIEELDRKRQDLEQDLSDYKAQQKAADPDGTLTPKGGADTAAIKREMDQLLRETEELVKEMERQN